MQILFQKIWHFSFFVEGKIDFLIFFWLFWFFIYICVCVYLYLYLSIYLYIYISLNLSSLHFCLVHIFWKASLGGSVVEESTSQAGGIGLIPVEDSWSRKRQPTIVFLPGIFHGPRSLLGYRAWARKESHKTEQLNNNILYFNNIRGPYKRLCMSETWNI